MVILAFAFVTLPAQHQGDYFPALKGFEIVKDYPVYHADDLWDYIDGAADNYLNYRFEDLYIAEYARGRDKVFFKVEVYHHVSPLYAFGIYTSERSHDYHFISLGTQGFRESNQIYFLKGAYYVKVLGLQEGSKVSRDLEALARGVAERIPGPTVFPAELDYFPDKGKVPNSERFIARDFLGHAFFDSVFTAVYNSEGREFSVFLTRRASTASARKILTNFYKAASGKVPVPLTEGDRKIHDGYNGDIYLIWKGNIIFGFQDTDNQGLIRKMAEEILDKIK